MRRERKNIRLRNFDYSSEFSHYITICTRDRQWFFGKIINGKMEYSPVGEIAGLFWSKIPNHFPHVILDEFIIMPNHMHGIIKLDYRIGTCHGMSLLSPNENINQIQFNKFGHPVSGSVSMIINHYKSAVKRWCNSNGHEMFSWQSRYYDHIINEFKDLCRIRKYIKSNPDNWEES